MSKNLKLFFVYVIGGPIFLFIALFFLFKFLSIDVFFSFTRVLFGAVGLYFLLILVLSKYLTGLEKKQKLRSVFVLITIWLLVFFASFLTIKYYSNEIKSAIFTCSMYHKERNFDKWWEINKNKYKNITKEEFKKFPFPNGIIKFSREVEINFEEIEVGNIISYYSPEYNENISHRVIKKWKENGTYFFLTLGDNNDFPEIVSGSYVNRKLIELKPLSFFERDGCKEKLQSLLK